MAESTPAKPLTTQYTAPAPSNGVKTKTNRADNVAA
ncbi:uncharacterized protein METZ01_LOCUS366909, partial [marine metagenome]